MNISQAGVGLLLACTSLSAAAPPPKPRLEAFDLTAVRLLDGFSKTAQETNTKYLLSLEPDRLLYSYRTNAGLAAPGRPYGGWEAPDCEVRGQFVGHYVTACALTYASTGDKRLKARVDLIVAEWAKCQKALGGGYLSAFPASFWDRLEGMRQVPWAPYYVIHKIMVGLLDAYQICGNKQALEVLKGMATYFKKRIDAVPEDRWVQTLNVEFGGMNDILYRLYAVTHDPNHLALAHKFDKEDFLMPLAEGRDRLAGLHGNTHIPIVQGAFRRYELTGEERGRKITEFFWDAVVHHHSFAIGGSTSGEVWGPANKLAGTLSVTNCEVCKTYNMLKVTRDLFRWTADSKYADFYERAWMNGIWGSQQPGTGQLEYYVPMLTGASRTFGDPENTFWCCYGSGVENWAKQGDSIYFHDAKDLWVNLFVPSRLDWRKRGVVVTQTTEFPRTDSTKLTISTKKPIAMAVNLRVPEWTTPAAHVKVNGAVLKMMIEPGTYVNIRRTWNDGDTVELKVPFALRVVPLPDDKDRVAVLNGPLVLAGVLGESKIQRGQFSAVAEERPEWVFIGDASHPNEWLKPVAGKPGEFETDGQKAKITFKPFYSVNAENYGLYWLVIAPGSERAKKIAEAARIEEALAKRVVDAVGPNFEEAAHNLQSQNSASGHFGTRSWRHADNGGWWSWDLKVLPEAQMTLAVTYWGNDRPPRTFDILVDGKVVATQSLDLNKAGAFFEVQYNLPQDVTRGKEKVTVRFQPHPGNIAGGVFGCRMLRP
jgi:uncharacterized protein